MDLFSIKRNPMADFIYCLNSSTIKPAPILEKIAIAGETGYKAIELWHDDVDAHVAGGGTVAEIRHALDDRALQVPTTIMLKGWCEPGGEAHAAGMAECRRRLEQAAELGAIYAVAGPPHGVVGRELAGERYGELLDLGLSIGVRPAMEYLGFADDVDTIEDAMEIMDGSGHPEATIVLDPFHCWVGGGPMESISKLTSKRIAISHFNDAPAEPAPETQRDPDRVLPGDGAVDLKKYCNLLRTVGYNGWLSLELFNEELWSRDPREVARIGLEKMQAAAEA